MKYISINNYIDIFRKENELIEINEFVSPELEITEITDRVSKSENQNKALLFINNGTKFPLLINSMGSEKRILKILGLNSFEEFKLIVDKWLQITNVSDLGFLDKLKLLPKLKEFSSILPKRKNNKGVCQENIIKENIDINIFPILKCWPYDGGKFITFPLVHTQSPKSKKYNVGMYRMQVIDNKTTGMHWHMHKTGASHYREYKELGIKKMPVSVSLGGDLIYTYCATAPLPENFDEYMLAGLLRNKGVDLVKCVTNDIYVPADSDIVIEGYVDTEEDLFLEGPFGDHTGYYSLEDYYPKFHITCITHKNNAIYPTTIVGIPPQEDAWIAKATERIFVTPLKLALLPEVDDMVLPFAGVAHNLVLISINNQFPGHAKKIANSIWGSGQMMFSKVVLIFDKSIDLNNENVLIEHIFNNLKYSDQIYFGYGPLDVLDHSSDKFAQGSKLCIDFTFKNTDDKLDIKYLDYKKEFDIKEITKIDYSSCDKNIPLIIISLSKSRKRKIDSIIKDLEEKISETNIKYIVFVDEGIETTELFYILWNTLGNVDPKRDITVISNQDLIKRIYVNSTRKNNVIDGFSRKWPNVLTSDTNTISKIDELWKGLAINNKTQSPSLKFINLNTNDGANVV